MFRHFTCTLSDTKQGLGAHSRQQLDTLRSQNALETGSEDSFMRDSFADPAYQDLDDIMSAMEVDSDEEDDFVLALRDISLSGYVQHQNYF